jgi:hypothetical protein
MDLLKQILRLEDHLGISLYEIQEIMAPEESLKELQRTFHENGQSPETQKAKEGLYSCRFGKGT